MRPAQPDQTTDWGPAQSSPPAPASGAPRSGRRDIRRGKKTAGRRRQSPGLRSSDRALVTARAVLETRFLKRLSGDRQPVESILLGVLSKQPRQHLEPVPRPLPGRISDPFAVLIEALEQHRVKCRLIALRRGRRVALAGRGGQRGIGRRGQRWSLDQHWPGSNRRRDRGRLVGYLLRFEQPQHHGQHRQGREHPHTQGKRGHPRMFGELKVHAGPCVL